MTRRSFSSHDKPKVGTFMLRIKLPAGRAEPRQLRATCELSIRYGRNAGELTTRQCVQLHYLGNPAYTDLPRKHKISISACASRDGAARRTTSSCAAASARRRRSRSPSSGACRRRSSRTRSRG